MTTATRNEDLEALIASTAPSGANIQPWRVYVLTGAPLNALGAALLAAARAGGAPPPAHFGGSSRIAGSTSACSRRT